MTHTTHNTQVKTMQRIMQNRGNSRIWLQGLAAYGWAAGKAYTVEYTDDAIIITHDQDAKRKVGKAKEGLIELNNKRNTRWAEAHNATHVDFTYYSDRIVITVAACVKPLAPQQRLPRADVTPAPSVPVMPTQDVIEPTAFEPIVVVTQKHPSLDHLVC